MRIPSILSQMLGLIVFGCGPVCCFAQTEYQSDEFFESRIRPVLIESCYECHNSHDVQEGGLALDHRQGLLEGGASGPAIVPGKPKQSLLLQTIKHAIVDLEMPQGADPLSEATIEDFSNWIAAGAIDPRDQPPTPAELESRLSWDELFERRLGWWSLLPITEQKVPQLNGSQKILSPVDRFVIESLNASELSPNTRAPEAVLVRRLFIQLTGLPPTLEQSQTWTGALVESAEVEEQRAAVWDKLARELLDSPHFGERWARHWMDWIRFAESHGSEGDPDLVGSEFYRDYLIRSLNQDVSVKQLLREHVAGDLLPKPRINEELQLNESVIGTAHWRMVFHGFAPTDAYDERVRFTDDQINSFSKAFLGLTVSCARCHDHKFDAVSQADYYALFGIFESCRPGRNIADEPARQNLRKSELKALKATLREQLSQEWLASIDSFPDRLEKLGLDDRQGDLQPTDLLRPFQLTVPEADLNDDNSEWQKWYQQVVGPRNELSRRQASNLQAVNAANPIGIVTQPVSGERSSARQRQLWNFREGRGGYELGWYAAGTGLDQPIAKAGAFSLSLEGEHIVSRIFPEGIYTHLLSDKHPGRLTSRDLQVEKGQVAWLLVAGESDASVRYAVRDYPRDGTVYPVARLNRDWYWQRFDLSYWEGDNVHFELATAMDSPLLVRNQPRSWFGIRDLRIQDKEAAPPTLTSSYFWPILEGLDGERPSRELLIERFQDALRIAIQAWQEDKMTDPQAMLLDKALAAGLLANTVAELPELEVTLNNYRRYESEIPIPRRVPGLEETLPRDHELMERGDHRQLGAQVPRRFLQTIRDEPYSNSNSGRLELAEDLVSDRNPLTKRVFVNRVWHHLFGQGLVRTPDNFGRLGDRPSHPELLDWLALRFAQDGWSLKELVYLLVTSETWQMDSQPSLLAQDQDPNNRMLSHANVRRMEAEAIRDSLLTVAGTLDQSIGGASIVGESNRRSIYLKVKRNALNSFLRTFDFPEPFSTIGRRDITNVPAQALTLMNDPFVRRMAATWIDNELEQDKTKSDRQLVRNMWRKAFGRNISNNELDASIEYLANYERLAKTHLQSLEAIQAEREVLTRKVAGLLEPIRSRLMDSSKQEQLSANNDTVKLPVPLVAWDFADERFKDLNSSDSQLVGSASIVDGELRLDGAGYFVSQPIEAGISEKTLEVWVRTKDLEQRGGGVVSVQSLDGTVFDALVFGEQESKKWLAGSNFFARTKSLQGIAETSSPDELVHFVLVYTAEGEIRAYRNGERYGESYSTNGPHQFIKNQTVVTLGLRHLPAGGNKFFRGAISEVRLYDRAISEEEIRASMKLRGNVISRNDIVAAMDSDELQRYENLRRELANVEQEIADLGPPLPPVTRQARFVELARALILAREFVYVR